MAIKLKYLENFLKIVELGSFSKAANQLDMSQSAISQQMENIEKYFGVKIFTRSIKGVSLTEEGKILLKRTKLIIDNFHLAKAEIEEKIKGISGILKISSSTTPGQHILPIYFSKFQRKNPKIKFQDEINDTTTSFNKLLNKEVDLAGVGSLINDVDSIEYIILAEEELVLVVPPDHELSNKKIISPSDILKFPYISRESTSGTRIESEKLLRKMGISPKKLRIFCELTTTESVLTAVSEGMGISLISSIAASKAEAANLVKCIRLSDSELIKRKLYLIRLKNHDTKNHLINLFWDFVKKTSFIKNLDT